MSDERRGYRKRVRAEREEETRRRITEAAVELHGTLGPARTSISAIAEQAGVRRSTVYRHFPDEAALFAGCSAHWSALHPLPDLIGWSAVDDVDRRLRTGLAELYAYYEHNHQMIENLLRDAATTPVVMRSLGVFWDYIWAARDTLLKGRAVRGRARQRVRAAIGHAVSFPTWHSLTREQGLDNGQAAGLMCVLVVAAAQERFVLR
jgi:AcrR family transcriptional regulator